MGGTILWGEKGFWKAEMYHSCTEEPTVVAD